MTKLKDIPSLTANKTAREIDYAKEFVLGTPWMVGTEELFCEYKTWAFTYAIAYMPNNKLGAFIVTYDGLKPIESTELTAMTHARHLTKEEEIKYLGAEK